MTEDEMRAALTEALEFRCGMDEDDARENVNALLPVVRRIVADALDGPS